MGFALKQRAQLAQDQEHLVGAGRSTGQGLAVQPHRRLGPVAALLLDVGGFQPQCHLQLRILGGLGRGAEAAHVGRRGRRHLGEKLQAGARRGLLGLDGDELDELLAGRRQIALALEHVRGFVDQRPGFVRAGEGQGHAQGRHHAIQPALLYVASAHEVERAVAFLARRLLVGEHALRQGAGHGVVAQSRRGQELLDLVEGLAGLEQVVEVVPGQAHAQLDGIVARNHAQALGENLGQAREVALPFEQVLELGRHLLVTGRGLEEGQQIGRGARHAAGIARHGRGVTQQAAPARAVGEPVEEAIVGGQQLVPLLANGAKNGQPFERPIRGRVEGEHGLQELDEHRRFAGVPFLEEAEPALPENREHLRRQAGCEGLAVGRRRVVRLLALGGRGLDVVPGLRVGWLGLDLLQRRLELVRGCLVGIGRPGRGIPLHVPSLELKVEERY